jgi:hypothetical protein
LAYHPHPASPLRERSVGGRKGRRETKGEETLDRKWEGRSEAERLIEAWKTASRQAASIGRLSLLDRSPQFFYAYKYPENR